MLWCGTYVEVVVVVVSVVVVLKDGCVSTRHSCHLNTFASHVVVVSGIELLEELVVVVVVLAGLRVSETAQKSLYWKRLTS